MTKIVCISDTHGQHGNFNIPEGDILIHTGDFSMGRGSIKQVRDFNEWLGTLGFENVIVTPGNHDIPIEKDLELCREIFTNCTLLINEPTTVLGIKFWGSPVTPEFGYGWAYNVPRGDSIAYVWDDIPEDTDIVMTHGPAYGMNDLTTYGSDHAGCEELAKRILEVCPLALVHGHIHEGYGIVRNRYTSFINASTCNLEYEPVNNPIVLEINNGKIINIGN